MTVEVTVPIDGAEILAAMNKHLTRTWVRRFENFTEWCAAYGVEMGDSYFYRTMLLKLPEGVNSAHPDVIDALRQIRESARRRGWSEGSRK